MLSFISMYILMYAIADSFINLYPDVNQFYLVGLLTMPMIIIEPILMNMIYKNKKLNTAIISISVVAFYLCIRVQAGVTDKQFLKGMIPNHAAAILMSKQSTSNNPDIQKLQQEIISSHEAQIKLIKGKLAEFNK